MVWPVKLSALIFFPSFFSLFFLRGGICDICEDMKRQQDEDEWLDEPSPRKETGAKKGKGKKKKTKTEADAMASSNAPLSLLVKRLNRMDLEELFVLACETRPDLAELAKEKLPQRLHTQSIAPLEVQEGVKPVFASDGDGLGLLQGIPTNILCLIFGSRKTSPLAFKDTYRFITSVCRSLRVLARMEDFFSYVNIEPRHIAAAVRACPGVLGCRELDVHMGSYDSRLCCTAILSQTWTRLTRFGLHGKKLTKGFWSKPMRTWALWKQLEEIEVDPSNNSKSLSGVAECLPDILKQCPQCIVLKVPAECMIACARALGEARGVGAYPVVRELTNKSRYITIGAMNWNQIVGVFPEMEKFDSGGATSELFSASAMPAPRILDLEISLEVQHLKRQEIEEAVQKKMTLLARNFPSVQNLYVKFKGSWYRSQKEIRSNPRQTAAIDFSPFSVLPLKNLKVGIASERSEAIYDVKADSLSSMVSLQSLEVLGSSKKNEQEILQSMISVPGVAVKLKPKPSSY
jgi:hypothetical protein